MSLTPYNYEGQSDVEPVTLHWVLWNVLMDQIEECSGTEITATDGAVARQTATYICEKLVHMGAGHPLVVFNDWSMGTFLSPEAVEMLESKVGGKAATTEGAVIMMLRHADPIDLP